MDRAKIVSFLLILFIAISDSPAPGQQVFSSVRISSTFNPVGSGARAMGMGGAFIAVADDATAASWNPGGLIQLETPEVSVVYSCFHWRDDYSSRFHSEAAGMNETTGDDLNYLSAALPFQLFRKNFVASVNFQRLYDMYKDLGFDYNFAGRFTDGTPWNLLLSENFRQQGGIKAFSPAIAYQVTPRLSIGATFNIWTDNLFWDNEWTETTRATGHGTLGSLPIETNTLTYEKFSNFEGFNMNLGFLWDMTRVITIGGVFKTPFTAHIDHSYSFFSGEFYPTLSRSVSNSFSYTDSMRIKMPASYGLGIAFRFSDALTCSFDIYRTQWSDFFRVIRGYKQLFGDDEYSDIDNRARYQSIVHDTTQIRTGIEYLVILDETIIPLRFGLFYDPRPSHQHPHDFYGFSVGSGFMYANLVIDYAYQFRTGKNVEGGVLGIPNTKADIDQHTFLISMIYHFD
ncbi:MAG: outer membrane protein transport protein [Deltaproteobacteria bacterium]|nr:outer membrane protein transport protein [Deltaproteobacteria bacterium]